MTLHSQVFQRFFTHLHLIVRFKDKSFLLHLKIVSIDDILQVDQVTVCKKIASSSFLLITVESYLHLLAWALHSYA